MELAPSGANSVRDLTWLEGDLFCIQVPRELVDSAQRRPGEQVTSLVDVARPSRLQGSSHARVTAVAGPAGCQSAAARNVRARHFYSACTKTKATEPNWKARTTVSGYDSSAQAG
jgi:hypothetical protein